MTDRVQPRNVIHPIYVVHDPQQEQLVCLIRAHYAISQDVAGFVAFYRPKAYLYSSATAAAAAGGRAATGPAAAIAAADDAASPALAVSSTATTATDVDALLAPSAPQAAPAATVVRHLRPISSKLAHLTVKQHDIL